MEHEYLDASLYWRALWGFKVVEGVAAVPRVVYPLRSGDKINNIRVVCMRVEGNDTFVNVFDLLPGLAVIVSDVSNAVVCKCYN